MNSRLGIYESRLVLDIKLIIFDIISYLASLLFDPIKDVHIRFNDKFINFINYHNKYQQHFKFVNCLFEYDWFGFVTTSFRCITLLVFFVFDEQVRL